MKEDEYINATNLAKLRSATSVLRNFIPSNANEKESYQKAMKVLLDMEDKLSKIVCIDPE